MKRPDEFELRPFSSIHRACNRHLHNEINNSLKNRYLVFKLLLQSFWTPFYHARQYFAVGTEYWCAMFEFCAEYIWNFPTTWKYVWTSFGWSIAARATFGVIFLFAAMLTGVAVDNFPMLYHHHLSAAQTRTWRLSLFSSSRALTRAKCCALGPC